MRQAAHFSLVTALHQSSLYIGKLLVQGTVNTGGTDMISAFTSTTRIEGFANSFGDSGARKPNRVEKTFRSSLYLQICLWLFMSALMYAGAGVSVRFMLGTGSGPAFENARAYMRLVAVFYTLCFTGNTFAGYFDGMGRVLLPFIGAAGHIALWVVLSWLLVGRMGLPAVALATGIGWLLVNLFWAAFKWAGWLPRIKKHRTAEPS